MSYYQGGQYNQHQQHQSPPLPPRPPPPPQQPQHQGNPDICNQYYNTPTNGSQSDPNTYGGAQASYTNQSQYHQQQYSVAGGGPVQPAQTEYHNAYYNQSVASQPPQQRYTYNPQDYSPSITQQPTATYDPRAYAAQPARPQTNYDPGAYASEISYSNVAGPVDPYAYNPNNYSTASSPQPVYSPTQGHFSNPQTPYSPAPPTHAYPPTSHYTPPIQQQQQQSAYLYRPPSLGPGSSSAPYPTDTYQTQQSHAGSQRHYTVSPPTAIPDGPPWYPSPPPAPDTEGRNAPSPLYASEQGTVEPGAITPGPTPPAHAPSRGSVGSVHPQSRPLPAHPTASEEYFPGSAHHDDYSHQDELTDDIENMLLGRASASSNSPAISSNHTSFTTPPVRTSSTAFSSIRNSRNSAVDRNSSFASGLPSSDAVVSRSGSARVAYNSDSDADGAAGLEMMRLAEEDDRRQSQAWYTHHGASIATPALPSATPTHAGHQSDSDGYGFDVSTFTGPSMPMSYSVDPNQHVGYGSADYDHNNASAGPSQHSSMRRSHASTSSRNGLDQDAYLTQPYNTYVPARVDAGATGGLARPTADGRRQSYDEGDEYALTEWQLPDRFPDEPPEIFFRPAASRPLPAPPYSPEGAPPLQTDLRAHGVNPGAPSPYTPDAFAVNAQGVYVPRSTSLVNHTNTPQVLHPLRSKTDAEGGKVRQAGIRSSLHSPNDYSAVGNALLPDLPALGKRFVPAKLGAPDFKKCDEPWSLSSLLRWLLIVTNAEVNTELRDADVKEALVALFTSKVPTMNIADAEVLSNRVAIDFYAEGALVKVEEWIKIVPVRVCGVIFQLTQSGCYSPTVHEHVIPNMRCYSHHCQRTLKKVSLQAQITRTSESWSEFYNLTKEDLEGKDKKELEKQNVLHEIVSTEEGYMLSLDVLKMLYRDPLSTIEPSVITPKRKVKFIQDVFGRLDAVKQANEDHLLPQLKYRQQEQGPYIVGFSDIFRQWIRKAKVAYVSYANDFPYADYLVRQEMELNLEFRAFSERARADRRSNRLPLDSFLKSPISRLQRYGLLLSTVLKNMKQESQEKIDLQIALSEIKAVALDCDARVAEMQRKIDLRDLTTKLVLRPGMQNAVELNLDHFGRELIYRGDLQRMGTTKFTWLDCHALLFDHYLILAKTVAQRLEQGGKLDKYDVSRLPIPMDLLILESANDPPVQKSSYVKGIATVSAVSTRSYTPNETGVPGRGPASPTPGGGLAHANTGASSNSLATVNSMGEKESERILCPFRVKHLGREEYTLFAPSENVRRDWCNKIIEAKTKHAAALHAQNAEPFKLRVMADSAFVLDAFGGVGKGIVIKGTPVDRAIKEVENRFKETGRPGAICRARVNCATNFSTPVTAKPMVAVGTDYGVFISEVDNPRGWSKVITMARVTQIAVLEEFNLFLLISDKSLIAYHLDVILNTERNGAGNGNDSSRNAPQKLSGSRDVGFFVAGKMKDRTLVMYKKREQLNSVFKVLEPVYQKSTEKKRGFFKRGTTEFFRDYDEFYIPTECTGMNLFHSSLAVSTARGFEVLTLDKKQPFTVPELRTEEVQNIAQHIATQRALSMLRLSDLEYLLCYANCAVYINKHGEVSRSVIMEFVGTAQAAALYGPYLVLFDADFVEIRNAQNGRLKQIIAGREVKCLDDGSSWSANPVSAAAAAATTEKSGTNGLPPAYIAPRTLKMVMQHPELEKTQIVMELILNENMKE